MATVWRDRPVCVTGASGLLGSALVKQLLEAGAQVVCLIRDLTPDSELFRSGLHQRAITVRGDVCDGPLVERMLGEYEVHTLFHLAAQTIIPIANRNPSSTFETNIAGTFRVLEACRRSPALRAVVVASSDKAYGTQRVLPYTEDAPLQGTFPYDVSKACADLIAQSYAKTYGLRVGVTRCGNLYGAGDLNWNRLVPGTIRSLLQGERPVIRSDGTPVRDYLFVEDAVAGYLALAEQLASQPELAGECFNFSDEQPLTVLALVDEIRAAIGTTLEPRILNEATCEIPAQYLAAGKARARLGWRAQHSRAVALQTTVEWYRAYLES